jgi:hypothetical protein
MEQNKARHLELEKCSQNLYKQGRSLFKDDREKYEELRKYKTLLFHDIFWRRRKLFALLMEKFVNDSIKMEQFEIEFSLVYNRTIKVYKTFGSDLKILEKLEVDSRPYELHFSSFIVSIFRQFEVLEDEECNEQDVYNLVQNNLLLMQPYLEFTNEIDISVFSELELKNLEESEIYGFEFHKPGEVSTENQLIIGPMLFLSLGSCFLYCALKPGFLDLFWNIIH